MKKYPFYKALFLSFFSADLYRDVLRNWKGMGLLYILLVSFIIGIFTSFNWQRIVNSVDTTQVADTITNKLFEDPNLSFEQNLNRILNIASQIPALKFNEGTVSIDKPQPFYITDPVSGKDLAIVDTTGQYNTLEDTDAYILLTKTRLVTRKDRAKEEVYYLSEVGKDDGKNQEQNATDLFSMLSQIPLITITNGIASVNEKTPYFIYDKDDKPLAIVDTSGTYISLDDTNAGLLITHDRIFVKNVFGKNKGSVKEMRISDLNSDLIFSAIEQSLINLKKILQWAIPLFLIPVITLSRLITTMISVVFFAIICVIISNIIKLENVAFDGAMRLSAVALTPVIFLRFFVPEIFPNQWIIYFLISLGYMYFAVSSNKQEQEHKK